jgi:hypothetical protein
MGSALSCVFEVCNSTAVALLGVSRAFVGGHGQYTLIDLSLYCMESQRDDYTDFKHPDLQVGRAVC